MKPRMETRVLKIDALKKQPILAIGSIASLSGKEFWQVCHKRRVDIQSIAQNFFVKYAEN